MLNRGKGKAFESTWRGKGVIKKEGEKTRVK